MLIASFFLIALVYSVVGFGGGSSYLALLAISNIAYSLIPKLALICNLLVVTGSCYHFYRGRHFNLRLLSPFIVSSVPMAFLGGMYSINENTFHLLLTSSLILAGCRLLFIQNSKYDSSVLPTWPKGLSVGAMLGLLSGVVGIGGGIFLAPLMMNLKWGKPKEVAATASAFICLNSLAGLAGQATKGDHSELLNYWPIFLSVVLGGQIGAGIGSHPRVSQTSTQRLSAVLILFIAGRLLIKIWRGP